jgi:SsrA-binding protein
MAKQTNQPGEKNIAVNRRARHDFFISDTWEAGLVLRGTEVKSLRQGKATITEAYVRLDKSNEAYLVGANIQPWEAGNRNNHPLSRPRKLLMHKRELERLIGKVNREGFTIVPLRLYFTGGRAKLEIGLGKGKKQHDKRDDQKQHDAKRDMERAKRRYR